MAIQFVFLYACLCISHSWAAYSVDPSKIASTLITTVQGHAMDNNQVLQCVEDSIQRLLTVPVVRLDISIAKCLSVVDKTLDMEVGSGSVYVRSHSGASGLTDDEEDMLPIELVSNLFCNKACGILLLGVIEECEKDTKEPIYNTLLQSCGVKSDGNLCLSTLASIDLDTTLYTCTTCTNDCKLSLQRAISEAGCCMKFAADVRTNNELEGSALQTLSEAFGACGDAFQNFSDECKNNTLTVIDGPIQDPGEGGAGDEEKQDDTVTSGASPKGSFINILYLGVACLVYKALE